MGSSPSDLDKNSTTFLGKLRSNFMGTEFQVFDSGRNPAETEQCGDGSQARKELAAVTYAANVLGSRGPRKMQVAFPAVTEATRAASVRATAVKKKNTIALKFCFQVANKMRLIQFRRLRKISWLECVTGICATFPFSSTSRLVGMSR